MKKRAFSDREAGCPLTRRDFIVASCAGAAGILASCDGMRGVGEKKRIRIRTIYALHAPVQPGPDWPNVGFDFGPVMDRYNSELQNRLPDFEFLPSMAAGPEEADKIIADDAGIPVDGYLVFQLNCWNRVVQRVAETGRPTLYVDFSYGGSGGFLVYTAGFLRETTPHLGFMASSRFDDVVEAVRCFKDVQKGGSESDFAAAVARVRRRSTPSPADSEYAQDVCSPLAPGECLERMKESKILAVGGTWPGLAPAVMEGMNIAVVDVPFTEVNDAWAAADSETAKAVADRWEETAVTISGVDRPTLETSAAMYLAQKAVLENHGANAITINCLGGFYGGHIHAYPCLGFHELLNEGLVGACECDVRSTATMVAMTALTRGRPGFISDPVIDTATRRIIYAHCVASNKVFGPEGKTNAFEILTHSEDRQGASVRSLLPLGYMTTTVEFAPERKTILFHKGQAVENVDDDRACRTKLAVEPHGDIERLFGEWDQWGWHRVTFYGDLEEPVYALAGAMDWQVLEEA